MAPEEKLETLGRDRDRAEGAGVGPPPEDLPTDPLRFWSASDGDDPLTLPPAGAAVPVLKRLGSPPWARGGFPLIGFLATVYEQVAKWAREAGRCRGS